jgi:hypothetical protein
MSNLDMRTHVSRPERIHDNLQSLLSANSVAKLSSSTTVSANFAGGISSIEPWSSAGATTIILPPDIALDSPNPNVSVVGNKVSVSQTGVYNITYVGTATATSSGGGNPHTLDFGVGVDGVNSDFPLTTETQTIALTPVQSSTVNFSMGVFLNAGDVFSVYARRSGGASFVMVDFTPQYIEIV